MDDNCDKIAVPLELTNRPRKIMGFLSPEAKIYSVIGEFKIEFSCKMCENVLDVVAQRFSDGYYIVVMVVDSNIANYPKTYKGYKVIVYEKPKIKLKPESRKSIFDWFPV